MPIFDEDVVVNGVIRVRDGYQPLTNDWVIVRNGEDLEIREPEHDNKVWVRFQDNVCLHLIGTPNLWVDGQIGVGTGSPTAKVELKAPWSDWMFLRQERDKDGGGFHIHNPWGNSNQPQGDGSRNRLEVAYQMPDGRNLWGQVVLHGPTGNVGIGTVEPKEKLHVNGNIRVTGDIALENADCAEEFTVKGTVISVEPGTVMVLDEEGALCPSIQAYDKKVVGVVSGAGQFKPALVLGKRDGDSSRVPIALVGKVFCKVDANYAGIEVGDLLTTSPTSGHAMKAIDPQKAFGSVLGKALSSHAQGLGMIPILVTLQ